MFLRLCHTFADNGSQHRARQGLWNVNGVSLFAQGDGPPPRRGLPWAGLWRPSRNLNRMTVGRTVACCSLFPLDAFSPPPRLSTSIWSLGRTVVLTLPARAINLAGEARERHCLARAAAEGESGRESGPRRRVSAGRQARSAGDACDACEEQYGQTTLGIRRANHEDRPIVSPVFELRRQSTSISFGLRALRRGGGGADTSRVVAQRRGDCAEGEDSDHLRPARTGSARSGLAEQRVRFPACDGGNWNNPGSAVSGVRIPGIDGYGSGAGQGDTGGR